MRLAEIAAQRARGYRCRRQSTTEQTATEQPSFARPRAEKLGPTIEPADSVLGGQRTHGKRAARRKLKLSRSRGRERFDSSES